MLVRHQLETYISRFGHHNFKRDSDKLREFGEFGKHAPGRWTEGGGFVLQDRDD